MKRPVYILRQSIMKAAFCLEGEVAAFMACPLYLKPYLLSISLCIIDLQRLFPPKWYQPISDSSLPAACFYFCLFQAINNSFTFLQAEFLWASLSLGWKIYWLHLRVGLVSMAIIPIAAFSSRILIISVPFC